MKILLSEHIVKIVLDIQSEIKQETLIFSSALSDQRNTLIISTVSLNFQDHFGNITKNIIAYM